MDEQHVKTVLDFMVAAQTVLAVYGSPDGPTNPEACYDILVSLLEDPHLLKAQMALAGEGKIILLLGEQSLVAPVFVDGGVLGPSS